MDHRIQEELQHNSTLVEYLAGVLSQSPSARKDLWAWAEQLVSGMEFEAFLELDKQLFPEERERFSPVLVAYRDLRRLVTKIEGVQEIV